MATTYPAWLIQALLPRRSRATAAVPRRDGDAFASIVALLDGTGEFDRVVLGGSVAQARPTAQEAAVAHVRPSGWRGGPSGAVHRELREVDYELTIWVRHDGEAEDGYGELARVEAAALNALLAPGSREYGGFCLDDHSRLYAGVYQSEPPDQVASIGGRFAYVTGMNTGYRTTA